MSIEKIKERLEQIIRHAKDNEPYQVEELVNVVLAELEQEQTDCQKPAETEQESSETIETSECKIKAKYIYLKNQIDMIEATLIVNFAKNKSEVKVKIDDTPSAMLCDVLKQYKNIIDRQQKEIEELNGWKEIAQESGGKIRVLISKYKIGLGGENIYDLVCDFAHGLAKENASLKEALEKIVKFDLCADCEDDCYNCDKYSALAKQALKGK